MSVNAANLALLTRVATALGPLRNDVVFLGGSIVGLLITDPRADSTRPTDDVDVAIEVATTLDYQVRIGDSLRELGFVVDVSKGAPVCRWIFDGTLVDIMPTDGAILGFNNRWYREALATATRYSLSDEIDIRLITAPLFLATKLDAFEDRGHGDYQRSADLEDIIAVIDGRPNLGEEARDTSSEVRAYLAERFRALLDDRDFLDTLPGHLGYAGSSQQRIEAVTTRLRILSDGVSTTRVV